jgi:putative nucleotide binding protein
MWGRDDYAIVLEFLPRGHATGRPEPLVQLLGDKFFTLLEAIAREGVTLKNGDRVYVGDGDRPQIERIKKRIEVNELTTFAKSELPFLVERLVREQEPRFVEFFNKALPVTTRMHQLELLPGIGKKHMFAILDERKKQPFTSYADIKARVHGLADPAKAVAGRIVIELEDRNQRFRLFVAGPPVRM